MRNLLFIKLFPVLNDAPVKLHPAVRPFPNRKALPLVLQVPLLPNAEVVLAIAKLVCPKARPTLLNWLLAKLVLGVQLALAGDTNVRCPPLLLRIEDGVEMLGKVVPRFP